MIRIILVETARRLWAGHEGSTHLRLNLEEGCAERCKGTQRKDVSMPLAHRMRCRKDAAHYAGAEAGPGQGPLFRS